MRVIKVHDLSETKDGYPRVCFVVANAIGIKYILHSDDSEDLRWNNPPYGLAGNLAWFSTNRTPEGRLLVNAWWEVDPDDDDAAADFDALEIVHQEAKAIATAIPSNGEREALDKRRRL